MQYNYAHILAREINNNYFSSHQLILVDFDRKVILKVRARSLM